jgi:hypothetical protein
MGGRGSASGKGKNPYGTEFETLLAVDNIKFVEYILTGETKIPLETQSASRNRIYVILTKDEELKSIATYGKDGIIDRQIDLDHDHGHGSPHMHRWEGYDRKIAETTDDDIKLYERVKSIWDQRK